MSETRRGSATCVELDQSGIAWVTLTRSDAANARNQAMRSELLDHYAWMTSNPDVRVVVLTGDGDRAFCAGMDMKESSLPESASERRSRLSSSRDIEALARLPMPTIAAINGFALGGGAEMALACDIRVMADEAQIGLTEVQFGLVPGGGGTQRLPRLVGASQALSMIYLGERYDGRAAVAMGLAHSSVALSSLRATTEALARRIAQQPSEALRTAKALVLASMEVPLADGLQLEFDALLRLLEARADTPREGGATAPG